MRNELARRGLRSGPSASAVGGGLSCGQLDFAYRVVRSGRADLIRAVSCELGSTVGSNSDAQRFGSGGRHDEHGACAGGVEGDNVRGVVFDVPDDSVGGDVDARRYAARRGKLVLVQRTGIVDAPDLAARGFSESERAVGIVPISIASAPVQQTATTTSASMRFPVRAGSAGGGGRL